MRGPRVIDHLLGKSRVRRIEREPVEPLLALEVGVADQEREASGRAGYHLELRRIVVGRRRRAHREARTTGAIVQGRRRHDILRRHAPRRPAPAGAIDGAAPVVAMPQQPLAAPRHLLEVLRVVRGLVEIDQGVQQVRFAPRERAAIGRLLPRIAGGQPGDQGVGPRHRNLRRSRRRRRRPVSMAKPSAAAVRPGDAGRRESRGMRRNDVRGCGTRGLAPVPMPGLLRRVAAANARHRGASGRKAPGGRAQLAPGAVSTRTSRFGEARGRPARGQGTGRRAEWDRVSRDNFNPSSCGRCRGTGSGQGAEHKCLGLAPSA
jgi:hypothetical protein